MSPRNHAQFAFLEQLALNYATLVDLPDDERQALYFELYQGTYEYLYRCVPLEVLGLEPLDVVNIIAEKWLRSWIDNFNPNRTAGSFRDYIRNWAQLSAKRVFRDTRETGPSWRTYDRYQKVKKLVDSGMTFEEACEKELNHSGDGLILQEQVRELFITSYDPMSLSMPIHGKVEKDGKEVSISETLEYIEPAFEMDRNAFIDTDTVPPRFREILEQLRAGDGIMLHEIDFGGPLPLIDKLVLFDNALRFASSQVQDEAV